MDTLTLGQAQTDRSSSSPPWGKWVKRSLLLLGLMTCLYVGAGFWSARGDLSHARHQISVGVLSPVLALIFLGWGLRSLRWHYYVRRLRWPVPWSLSLFAFFASFAFSATPGKIGELVKSVLLRTRYNIPLSDGAGVLVVERLGDLLAVLVLAAGGLTLLPDGRIYFAVAALLVAGLTLSVSNRAIHAPLLSRLSQIPKLARVVNRVGSLLDTGRSLLQPGPFLIGGGIALVAWSCEGLAFYLLLRGFGVVISPITACSIYGIATVVGALSALPGGLGSFEVVMVLLLSRVGLPAVTATVPVLLLRFCTLWLGSFVGLLFLAGWLSRVARNKPAVALEVQHD